MADHEPSHIVDHPGDRHSRCGIKDPLPVTWARYVQRHIDGYGMPVCEKCAEGGWPVEASDG
jgi:hypothetical protein